MRKVEIKLKTLKNLIKETKEYYKGNPAREDYKEGHLCAFNDTKQEAIKLIKDIRDEKESSYCLSQGCLTTQDMKEGAIRGLRHYLDITEEDLK